MVTNTFARVVGPLEPVIGVPTPNNAKSTDWRYFDPRYRGTGTRVSSCLIRVAAFHVARSTNRLEKPF